MRQAVEGHMGMLTCQLIHTQVQLQAAHAEIARLSAELARVRVFVDEETTDAEVLRAEAKFEHEA